jgi:hypothetical protein
MFSFLIEFDSSFDIFTCALFVVVEIFQIVVVVCRTIFVAGFLFGKLWL